MDPTKILEAFRLDGSIALVTGGSRGLGRAMAAALAGAGAEVAIAGRELHTLEPVAAELAEATGRRILPVQLDVADVASHAAALEKVREGLGAVNILVNNAGMNIRKETLEFTPEDWDKVLDTNLRGTFFLTLDVVREMIARGHGGKVLNISSMTAFLGLPTTPAYSASKASLQQLTKLWAVEWAEHNIQVNAIAPGWISTEMTRALKEAEHLQARHRWILGRTPAGRFGEPDELAGAAVYLCSPAADFVTGQVLAVDGGILAGSDWRKG
jgi:NAD(P)-dependent dehydrogenase (short-subunit alcohol dehydrogenase family)